GGAVRDLVAQRPGLGELAAGRSRHGLAQAAGIRSRQLMVAGGRDGRVVAGHVLGLLRQRPRDGERLRGRRRGGLGGRLPRRRHSPIRPGVHAVRAFLLLRRARKRYQEDVRRSRQSGASPMEREPQAREQPMFKGSFTALITPFKGGQVDDKAFQQLVEWQIAEGTHGLVPVGTTGESPTLSHEEHKHVIELCIKTAKKRVPVIAGAGSNSTDEAIDLTLHAKKAGADATLHSTGYYNKPTQEGLY